MPECAWFPSLPFSWLVLSTFPFLCDPAESEPGWVGEPPEGGLLNLQRLVLCLPDASCVPTRNQDSGAQGLPACDDVCDAYGHRAHAGGRLLGFGAAYAADGCEGEGGHRVSSHTRSGKL